jgi:hypothetical protein
MFFETLGGLIEEEILTFILIRNYLTCNDKGANGNNFEKCFRELELFNEGLKQ